MLIKDHIARVGDAFIGTTFRIVKVEASCSIEVLPLVSSFGTASVNADACSAEASSMAYFRTFTKSSSLAKAS